jgi:hypothetical protein
MMQTLAVVCLTLALGGCIISARDLPNYKQEGMSRVYPVTEDQAWTIARSIFRSLDEIDAIEERRPEGYMLTSTGAGGFTWGTVIGTWFERVDDTKTKVTIVTKRRLQTNISTSLTETTFHRRFEQAVDILKRPLPPAATSEPRPAPDWCKAENLVWRGDSCVEKK